MIVVYHFDFDAVRTLPLLVVGGPEGIAAALAAKRAGAYRPVAEVDTDNRDVAWRLTNSIDSAWFEPRDARCKPLVQNERSTMVGDLFETRDPSGSVWHFVDTFGFKAVALD